MEVQVIFQSLYLFFFWRFFFPLLSRNSLRISFFLLFSAFWRNLIFIPISSILVVRSPVVVASGQSVLEQPTTIDFSRYLPSLFLAA
jgi:hypothetical protein